MKNFCILNYTIVPLHLGTGRKPAAEIKFNILIFKVMKATIYNGIENLTKKEVIRARSTEKKQVRTQLADFGASLESAYKQLTATGASTRNAANNAKGTYRTALQVVAACYPYQTAAGELCTKTRDGYKVRTLKGTAAAYAVVRTAVCNFIDYKTGRRPELVTVVEVSE